MCKSCIIKHLECLLNNVRLQIEHPDTTQVILTLCKVDSCTPFMTISPALKTRTMLLRFPGNSQHANVSFAVSIRICGLVLANLKADKIVTTRDLFYQDIDLFKNQNVVARKIEQLTRYFKVPRSMLNVLPSPNGLVAGDLTISLADGSLLEIRRSNGPSMIPVSPILSASALSPPNYILVVEKEAVFSYLQSELVNAIVVTGKGFPDRATRCLLNALSISYPQTPIYGLVDSDPHGILIMRNYESGSMHAAEIQHPIDIKYLGVNLLDYNDGLIPTTVTDMRVAMSTLKKDWIREAKYQRYKEELQRGLFMGVKGEMNLIDQHKSSRLSSYVCQKIAEEASLGTAVKNGSQQTCRVKWSNLPSPRQPASQPKSARFRKRSEPNLAVSNNLKRFRNDENINLYY